MLTAFLLQLIIKMKQATVTNKWRNIYGLVWNIKMMICFMEGYNYFKGIFYLKNTKGVLIKLISFRNAGCQLPVAGRRLPVAGACYLTVAFGRTGQPVCFNPLRKTIDHFA